VSDAPLRVTVISAEHLDELPELPLVSRSYLSPEPDISFQALDELRTDSDFWTSEWPRNLLGRLRGWSNENAVGYVVPGHPMIGDSTVQHLLRWDSEGIIDLEFYDEPLPLILTELLAQSEGSPAFVDAVTLIDIARTAPYESGTLPLHSNQTTVITNLIPGTVGVEISDMLCRRFRPDTLVRLIPMVGEPMQAEISLSDLANEASGFPSYLVVPAVSGDEYQKTADDLQRLVARLRAPGGCPWDREQTNQSLGRNLVEETYELLDAIESGNRKAIREELGDFLLQAIMHSQITHESGSFSIEDVIGALITKLVRRHPHVFERATADTPSAVTRTWDEIKRSERAARPGDSPASPLGDIPADLPALLRAQSVVKRASRANVDIERLEAISDSAYETLQNEFERQAVARVLSAVQDAQEHDVDVEQAVRSWTRAFEQATADELRNSSQTQKSARSDAFQQEKRQD
jgi:tetrapyrrole methylase family protein / MazG family protein